MDFSVQLQEARKACGLSQEQVAALMNMSRQGISHWENGRALPDAETLKRLSQVLHYNFIEQAEPDAALPEHAAEGQHVIAAEACDESFAAPVPFKKRMPLLWCAVCLIAGIALGWGLSLLTSPGAAPVGLARHASLTMQFEQNPVLPVYMGETATQAMWLYTVQFVETAGIDFTLRKVTLIQINDDGSEAYREWISPEQMGLQDGLIKGCDSALFRGGLPVQDIHGIRLIVTGVDAMYNELSFEDYVAFSKVLPV